MANWTPEYSAILSHLLDKVVGTTEMREIRQDYCKIFDRLKSIGMKRKTYFTGSKSEGLYLPGSDDDFMYDVNDLYLINVLPSSNEYTGSPPRCTLIMCTENVPHGFALLQLAQHTPLTPGSIWNVLNISSRQMYGLRYLSSDLFMNFAMLMENKMRSGSGMTLKRQGPSVESWPPFGDKAESGVDNVSSIHCSFWPKEASEWPVRPRKFEWPTSQDVSEIVNFGFHIVPVGHPLSVFKSMEWRISFSVAERTLVWSFNHVQMQCYAVMKIILKEFIQVKSSPQNQVLCSYFIKTFLFWKYETAKLDFWRSDNLRECIKYLLVEFSKCIQEGVLRHYFIPKFNLLSIKVLRPSGTNYWENVEWIPYVFCKE